ncbi:MAG: hypothetical protein KKG03_06045 [Gammaproteobacteria bacterium]|nr:hypothetical protein [Sideroxydans sp.]MBU3903613.1 hypothetical protein [Gammaproteobacteria bacterium]MBU4045941.1 hypothetical protein [Gammaproteobacteria bacterium]MBU4151197.1 hypothetical protein [Gammaproteobacteria bacterium]
MNIRYASLLASLLFALSASAPVQASEDAPLPTAPSEMTQEEYDAYRARVREQMEAAQQTENKDEAAATTTRRNTGNGYGQGYRARQERAGGNGAMGRTGGHGR